MKRIVYIISLLVVATAYSSQIQRQVPATLLSQAERLSRRLHNATVLDAATRAEATSLLGSLVNFAGTESYVAAINANIQRLTTAQSQEKECVATEKVVAAEGPMEDVTTSLVVPTIAQAFPIEIPIHAGRLGGAKREMLDTQNTEAIKYQTFSELIQERIQQDEPFLLARVITRNSRGEYIHYYDAVAWNRWRFGDDLSRNAIVNPNDPKTGLRPAHKVQYFIYDPEHRGSGFTLMFTEDELRESIFLRNWLNAYQNDDQKQKIKGLDWLADNYAESRDKKKIERSWKIREKLAEQREDETIQAKAQAKLGNAYAKGDQGLERDYQKALQYLTRAEQHRGAEPWYSGALLGLGAMYAMGNGVAKDLQRARLYFELAASQQNSSQRNKAFAYKNLGDIYLYGDGVEKNYNQAKRFYDLAMSSEGLNPEALAGTKFSIAYIYRRGGYGFDKNLEQSLHFYKQVAEDQHGDEQVRMQAYQALAKIYLLGQGTRQDLNRARFYLTKLTQQTLYPAAAPWAQQMLAQIAQEEKKTQATIGEKHTLAGEGPTAKRQR